MLVPLRFLTNAQASGVCTDQAMSDLLRVAQPYSGYDETSNSVPCTQGLTCTVDLQGPVLGISAKSAQPNVSCLLNGTKLDKCSSWLWFAE